MKIFYSALVLLISTFSLAAAPVPIFDGKTLEGWDYDSKIWRVEDGMITGGSATEKIDANYFICAKNSYANFDLRLKIKLSGDPATGMINSGVQIRSLRVPGSSEMSGYQVDYGQGWYGKLYDESRRNKVIAESADLAAATAAINEGDWNEYRIRAEGPRIRSWINGVPALDYTESDANSAQDGFIGIQIHKGGKALVQVKDVTIKELPPTPNAPTWEKLGGIEGVRAKLAPPKKSAAAGQDSDTRENAGAGSKVKPKRDLSYNAVASAAKTPEEERATFTVPDGFEVQLVAAESEGVGKFVPLAFDQHGALWTTTAFEYPVDGNENPAAADALYASHARDKVLIYDRDPRSPTGYASKPRVFAEGLAIPLGVLPYKKGCYVQHGHDIAFLEDTDNDGKADKRTVILTGFGVQDSHLFPHQFLRAPGGWIWMAQGAFNYGKVTQPGGEKDAVQFDQTRMAKFRPDGSEFTITSNGPCNIWGLVLNGEGEAFIQEANDFGYPVMPFHEYANYPGCSDRQWKSYAPEFPGTAPDFRMGGTGLSGLALTDKDGPFPEAWRDIMLVANPITNRVQGIKMHRDGPYWKLDKPTDFLVSSDPWFRPVAITIGPDGCLYIVDWYNKIISHNEVPRNHPDRDKTRGRIWRVVAKNVQPFTVPDFTRLTGDELIAKLGGPSLAQSHLAWQTLTDGGIFDWTDDNDPERLWRNLEKLEAIVGDPAATPGRRIQAYWAMEEQNIGYEIQPLMTRDPNPNVRREALRSAAERQWAIYEIAHPEEGFAQLAEDPDPTVRAELIKELGSNFDHEGGDEQLAIRLLLKMGHGPLAGPTAPSTRDAKKTIKVGEAYDREFERYLVRMLIERQLEKRKPRSQRDSIPQQFIGVLDSLSDAELPIENRLLATLALDPKTSAARVAKLLPQLRRAPGQEEILRLAQFPDEPAVGEALKAILASPVTSSAALESLLAVRTRLDTGKITPLLADAAQKLLTGDAAHLELGFRLVSAFKLASVESAVVALLQRGTASLSALRTLAEIGSSQSELFAKLVETSSDPLIRDEALVALAVSRAPDAPAKVLALYTELTTAQRRTALDKLSATKPGSAAIVAALTAGTLAKTELDAATLDRLQAVLGPDDPTFAKLVDSLGALFRPVLAFDGSEAAWTQTNVTLDGPCTIEAWVRLDPQGRKIGNADSIAGAPGQLVFNFFGERARIYAFPPLGDVAVAKKPIMPGLWTHVAATRDAVGIWKIYLDGEFDSAGTKPAPGKIENVRLAWSGAKGGTEGALAEFRLWNCERTAEQIRATCDRSIEYRGQNKLYSTTDGFDWVGKEGLIFSSADIDGWGKLQAGAKITKTSDFPPILTPDEAAALDAKYAKNRALAEQPGDVEKGKVVAALCQACHLMGPTGGNIGPNLSGVGAMGTEAILRNILQPNAAMENGYRIFRVELKNGDLVDALFVSEDQDAVIVRLPGAPDRRIAKSEIRSTKYLRRSLMPEGLLETMTPEQVTDLFAFLKTLK